jgi:asparagine synthase (glutamine-hydrolysing)
MVADVPVGVLLSGGVDSSLVTAMAARSASKVKTFTVRFPGHGQYDETDHARLIARHFSTEHTELDASDLGVDLLPLLARQVDEPMVDSSIIPTYLVSKLIREHCTVALGGDGGDELFGGYPHYSRLLWMQEKLGKFPRSLRSLVAIAARSWLPIGFKGSNWLQAIKADFQHGLPLIASCFGPATRQRLMIGANSWEIVAEQVWECTMPHNASLLQRATRMDFRNYLAEDILVKVDRASMLSSLEVRAPFLDHRIIEFAFGSVPDRLKATIDTRKVLLKKLTRRLLPPSFDQHRKQGFSIPLGSWMRSGPWHSFIHEVLLASDSTLFDRKVVRKLLAGQVRGRSNSERLFALLMFELWRREYRASF